MCIYIYFVFNHFTTSHLIIKKLELLKKTSLVQQELTVQIDSNYIYIILN